MSSFRHRIALGIAGADAKVLSWWRALCTLSVLNVCLWVAVWHFGPVSGVHGGLQLVLSGVYVLVCAYRSVLPRVDLERLVIVDTRLSSIFLGRTARYSRKASRQGGMMSSPWSWACLFSSTE